MKHIFTLTISQGLEDILASELRKLQFQRVTPESGAVRFYGTIRDGYRACLWSRTASRVLLRLARFQIQSAEDLYEGISAIKWNEHMTVNGTLWVDFVGTSRVIRHSQFGARKVKDAIVDQFLLKYKMRPNVEKYNPDLRINVHLRNGVCTVAIDLAGAPLHLRTPNKELVTAPLRETLAASLLLIADWPKYAKEGYSFVDPMCGSGTFLSEAYMIANKIAPNLRRRGWGFQSWLGYDQKIWNDVLEEAKESSTPQTQISFYGSDISKESIRSTRKNLKAIGASNIKLEKKALIDTRFQESRGFLICNPPYGERMEEENLSQFYRHLGDHIKQQAKGWNCFVFAPRQNLKQIGLRPNFERECHNANLLCRIARYDIHLT
jgi:23S rRNA (guanine2445-N2)-methyltransferase / 23S rRNA (guanine2069-N7)-methyltransferase